jgi:crossover junction endodeoxyribonuclease RuvC
MPIILGIDPGSRIAGFGVIEVNGSRFRHVDHGTVDASKVEPFEQRLVRIGTGFREIIKEYSPAVVIVEKIFLGKNVESAFRLGHARGVCLFEAAAQGVSVVEYAARLVKKGITGSGASTKDQVRVLVLAALGIKSDQALDATDALSLAFFHHLVMDGERRIQRGKRTLDGESR